MYAMNSAARRHEVSGRILEEYIELGPRDAAAAVKALLDVLDGRDVVAALTA